jgi:fibronectin-binding autotransporter adhesin
LSARAARAGILSHLGQDTLAIYLAAKVVSAKTGLLAYTLPFDFIAPVKIRSAIWLATGLVMLDAVLAHRAQAQTWNGTSGADWGTPGSWTPSGVPGASGTATFSSTGGTTVANASTELVKNLVFDSTAQAYTIGSVSGGSLALTAGGSITDTASSVNQTVNAPLTLGGNYTFTAASAGLTIGGTVTDAATSATQTLTLAGRTGTLSGLISDGSGGGTLGLAKSGTGTWLLNNTGNSFSGPITITAGTLSATSLGMTGSASALGAGGTITFAATSSSTPVSLNYSGTGETSNKSINFNGTSSSGTSSITILASETTSAGLDLSGALSFGAAGATALTLRGSNAFTNTLEGNITNSTASGSPVTSLTKNDGDT